MIQSVLFSLLILIFKVKQSINAAKNDNNVVWLVELVELLTEGRAITMISGFARKIKFTEFYMTYKLGNPIWRTLLMEPLHKPWRVLR